MATLVLTTVGALAGGPIGAAIGAVVGNQVDRAVLAPKGRQGPRLGDLTVQTSSYGSQIPRLFGRMRVAGTVIWATDLREDSHSSGGGKAGPKTTSYSYSASFAVVLSARPIVGVRRIWADGKLLRGTAGDWKTETGFRLYLGGEDQPVDPLIASAEGIDATSAHRGLAYAVFDAMQLADFGNRIPSLTFEVEADVGDVDVGAIARALSDGAIIGTAGAALTGYAASGDSVRGALQALAAACPLPLRDDGRRLLLADPSVTSIDDAALVASPDGTRQPVRRRDRRAAGSLPDAVSIAYYEPARDYQAGLQNARRDGIGRKADRIDLPAAVSADDARRLADAALARGWREREQATVSVPWRLIDARAGSLATLGDDPSVWRITGWTLERMTIELRMVRKQSGSVVPGATDPGRAAPADDTPAGSTRLILADLPAPDDSATAPQLWLAAAGTGAGWRRASVSSSLDGGATWQPAGQTALPAILGRARGILAAGPATLFDREAAVEVELLNDAMTLVGADDAALLAGANLALLGDELIQFGAALQTGPRRYRLSRLLRGRRGSEWAIGAHAVDEDFLLIDTARMLAIDVPLSAIGATLMVSATGPGDGGINAGVSRLVIGRAVRPPAPVHLCADRQEDGTIRFSWVRRSRAGWPWLDGTDTPLGEDAERYRLVITPAVGTARTVETGAPLYEYLPAEQAADGIGAAASMTISVTQLGARAQSMPGAEATWTL